MYKETGRILPRSEKSEHGEDFMRNKVKQLKWLFDGAPANFSWDLVAVDDGCPEKPSSAEVASGIIKSEGWDNVKVMKLQDGINAGNPVAKMKSTKDSRKGGAILYGLYECGQAGHGEKEHIVLYTDSDLSANLGMSGLLCHNIVAEGHPISCGHRYGEAGSILVKSEGAVGEPEATGGKPDKMIIVFRHWARGVAMPCIAQVKDTQCGFKAFKAKPLLQILPDVTSYTETFDVELLIRACTTIPSGSIFRRSKGIGVVPILFVEDFEASTMASSKQVGGKLEPGDAHLEMIQQIMAIHDSLMKTMAGANKPEILRQDDALMGFLRGLDLPAYKKLIAALIEADAELPPAEKNDMFARTYRLDDLKKWKN